MDNDSLLKKMRKSIDTQVSEFMMEVKDASNFKSNPQKVHNTSITSIKDGDGDADA